MGEARTLMVQGTMSNAGKSLMVAGLCRHFKRAGLRVAPFKSQNMALNSFITDDGLEMGRAQVMQAEACGIAPDARMNPILLKPEGDAGSQVIVNGEVRGSMSAVDYARYRKNLITDVERAFGSLAAENDLVIIEGAGSPAEINLGRDDLVNMGMARIADAPVLLVGDIDLGGVFAQLYGTMQLLESDDRRRVRGLVVNKFRGDASILRPGLGMLEDLCGVPVIGVMPYLKVDVDDEDSLAVRLGARGGEAPLDIAVIRLPRLSNFTDFNEIARHPAMGIRYVDAALELGRPDLVILPGTKSTLGDLSWLRQSGLATCIQALAAHGTPVLGICGGYQMLGERIADPVGVEGGGDVRGLGLLPVSTVFEEAKTRTRACGRFHVDEGIFSCLDGLETEGYEIHMGATEVAGPTPVTLRVAGAERGDGAVRGDVMGTYLHGVLDAAPVVEALACALLARRGLSSMEGSAPDAARRKEAEYDKLADAIEAFFDTAMLQRIVEEGVGR